GSFNEEKKNDLIERKVIPAFKIEIESHLGSFRGNLNARDPATQLKVIQYLLLKEGHDQNFHEDPELESQIQELDEMKVFSMRQAAIAKVLGSSQIQLTDNQQKEIQDEIIRSLRTVETTLLLKAQIRECLQKVWSAWEPQEERAAVIRYLS